MSRVEEPHHLKRHRHLIRATGVAAASEILQSGMRQMRNMEEFHFAEMEYDERQAQYITSGSNSRRVWLILDTQLAAGLGYTFSKLPNGVVLSQGIGSAIHRSVFASEWISDTQRISIPELVSDSKKLVTVDHDDAHPPPRRTDVPSRSEPSKRNRSPTLSSSINPSAVTDCQSAFPTPSQLGLPENERPASWTPPDEVAPERVRHCSSSPVSGPTVTRSPEIQPKPPILQTEHSEPIFSHAGFRNVASHGPAPGYVAMLPPM